jgi:hypothetical protein
MGARAIPKTWIGREELEASLLISLKQRGQCSDLAGVCIYDCGHGRWTIGHVRLGLSGECCEITLNMVERQFAKVFLLLPG